MKVGVEVAREYMRHPSQQLFDLGPEDLPEDFEYRAKHGLCLIFHGALWPGVYMVHCLADPKWWGDLDETAIALLGEFWDEQQPERIIAWVLESNRAVCAFTRRVGFVDDGRMALDSGDILMKGWRKWV